MKVFESGEAGEAGEAGVVAGCGALARLGVAVKLAELDPQDRGLQRIKAAVASHHIMAVFDLLPVVGNHSNLLGKRRIAGK